MTGRLAQLPLLTEQELDVLILALITYDGDLEVQATCGVADAVENRLVAASLLTAVREAKASVR